MYLFNSSTKKKNYSFSVPKGIDIACALSNSKDLTILKDEKLSISFNPVVDL